MKKTLIVVDMLNDFLKPDGGLYCGPTAEAIIPAVKAKVDEYFKNGDHIIFLADAHDEDDLEFNRFPKHCIDGTKGANLIDTLEDTYVFYGKSTLISKTRYSGFYGTRLEDILKSTNPDIVEVVGICTSICVMDTVGGLANRDYKINVYKDMVADFDSEMHEMALKRMVALYGVNLI